MRFGSVPARRATLAIVAALALLACGKDGDRAPTAPPPESAPSRVTFTQIWVGYSTPNGFAHVTRSKAEARELATSLIARIKGGERMESLVAQYSDDREPGQYPFNDGSYTKMRNEIRDPEVRRVVFSLKVGEVASAPVDSGVGFHVIRRDL